MWNNLLRAQTQPPFLLTTMQSRPRFLLPFVAFVFTAFTSLLHAEDYAFTSIAGTSQVAGNADGTPGTFKNPYAVAVDSAKNVYVSDTGNNIIRKITPGRVVSTIAGSAGVSGSSDGAGSAARF